MRHGKKFNHLGRQKGHRKALLQNLANALIAHKRITTTLAKAKALRVFIEPLLTKSKNSSTHSQRVVFSHLQQKETVAELFNNIAPKIADRPGGYTRIIKLGSRLGDAAEMAMIELVDYNDNLLKETKTTTGKKRRSRRGGAKKADQATKTEEKEVVAAPAEEAAPEAPAEETAAVEEAPAVEETKEEVAEAPAAEETKEEAPEAKADEAGEEEEKKD